MRRFYPETFLIALAVILLEVSYTRLFSYKLVYYFTYLVIGISLLGLGAGGVFVALFESLRRQATEKVILATCVVAGISVGLGYLIVALVPLHLFRMMMWFSQGEFLAPMGTLIKLTGVLVVLFIPFLAAGIALSTIFAAHTERIGRLYFADLLGAALGAALVIPALQWISPPGTVFLAGVFFALAGARLAMDAGPKWKYSTLGLGVILLIGVLAPQILPDPIRDRVKGGVATGSIFTRWSPVFRVDVVPGFGEPMNHFLFHDGTIGSSIINWDGDLASLGRYDEMDRSYPFRLLPPNPRVAIVGSAGGNEILASLHFGSQDITGIELNPVTVGLLEDDFADFTGHLASREEVRLVNAEGRAFLKASEGNFDLIWLVAPDSYAAMNAATSGAFVLSESYLYTREMIEETVARLTPSGILCAQFGEIEYEDKPNRTLRYLGTAREALAAMGIDDFAGHVLVATTPGFERLDNATIMIGRSPFSPEQVQAFHRAVANVDGSVVRFAPAGPLDEKISTVIVGDQAELRDFHAEYPYKVHAIDDDSPFFWNFVRFGDLLPGATSATGWNIEEGVGERLLVVFVLIATALAALFLLLPLAFLRDVWGQIPYKWNAGVYFASLGLGFMFIEVCLIQRLTLFLGYPTYSLTVTLFAVLISTGIGSLASERYATRRNRAFGVLLASIAALIVFYEWGLPRVVDAGMGWPFGARVAFTVACLLPLGLCLGAFMPLGLGSVARVTAFGDQYVAWCWAINGFFSVMASVLATLLSMTFGFGTLMLIGLGIYAVGVLAFSRVPVPAE